MNRILIVDNDEGLIHFLSRLFVKQAYEVTACTDGTAALERLAHESFDAIFLDYKMPGLNGLDTLVQIKRAHVKTPVVIMTAHGTTETAIEAMKRGAYDYLLKPFDTEELKRVAADALEVNRLMKEVVGISDSAARISAPDRSRVTIVGSHRRMQSVFKLIGQVAEKDVTVLITGESGTGKELAARAIYHHSRRKDKPFMAINCASIPDTLFESELFGYERGAFTGADRTYLGKFERCHGGTLFFDEIGDMSLSTQAKLLRVLQEGEFERLGSSDTIRVDVRILAATNKNLEKQVELGLFREDLYYRLKIVSVELPPLRERLDDVPALTDYFVARFAEEYDKPLRYLPEPTIRKLQSQSWPGNVRQLENCLRRAVLMCKGDVLLPEHVALAEAQDSDQDPAGSQKTGGSLFERLEEAAREILQLAHEHPHANLIEMVETALLTQALRQCNYNQVHTARRLGISRNTLRHRIKKYRLEGGEDGGE